MLLMAGCTSQQEPQAAGPASPNNFETGPPAATPSAEVSSESDAGEDAAAPAAVGDVPADPVAAVPGQRPGMVLEVYRLARTGETATLTMAVFNEGAEDLDILQAFQAGRGTDFDAGGISLLDPVGLQRYLVLRDTQEGCLCSVFGNGVTSVEPGARLYISASFPAPPADVTAVTVETPSGSLVDVPIAEA